MTGSGGAFSPVTRQYLERLEHRLSGLSPADIAHRVAELVHDDEQWRRTKCLNMNAAENTISRRARRLLDSDLVTRVTEGFPGEKSFPVGRQNERIDEIESIVILLARKLFGAAFLDWRAISTTMANSAAFHALTSPGDTILVQSMEGGGNLNYQSYAIPGLRGLHVVDMPIANDWFEIDVDGVREAARRHRPKMLVVGGSCVLFPYPMRKLREIADEVGAYLFCDAAHVGLFIAAGLFPAPLEEGAHILSMGTQKTLSGPVGGLLFTNDEAIARRVLELTFPALLQTRDQNKYAATAHVLAEMMAFGADYARQMLANARALATALDERGFSVLAKERDYTTTHQIFLDAGDYGARTFEAVCRDCNILFHANHMRGDGLRGVRTGIRISVMETTRQGMREAEMRQIAEWVYRATIEKEPAAGIAAEVASMLRDFQTIRYSFDEGPIG